MKKTLSFYICYHFSAFRRQERTETVCGSQRRRDAFLCDVSGCGRERERKKKKEKEKERKKERKSEKRKRT